MIEEKHFTMSRLRVKELAEARGWNVPRLSQESKVPQTVIWEIWRNPERNTTTDVLNRIAKALEVNVKELFDDDQQNGVSALEQ